MRKSFEASKRVRKDDQLKKMATLSERELMMELRTSPTGLKSEDAARRLEEYGINEVSAQKPTPAWRLFFDAFNDPFVYILILLMVVSFFTKDYDASVVVGFMITASVVIHFVQDYRSQKASLNLKHLTENTASVMRDGTFNEHPMEEIVPGDVIQLSTGDMIPADAVLIQTKDLFVNQSSLTGESVPVEKRVGPLKEQDSNTTALDLQNLIFMGTDVISGTGTAIILKTGANTFFGDVAKHATTERGATAFDIGLKRVSRFLLIFIGVLFPIVFLLNGFTKGDWMQAFFFAIAVAVGLTPEMLPMIVTSNLAKGAITLARKKVIVKELPAIQNLGSMDVLCTDKTGTITEDRIVLVEHVSPLGEKDSQVLEVAFMNSEYQTGWKNIMDLAVIDYWKKHGKNPAVQQMTKVDEIPFDFLRRRLTVVLKDREHQWMITKGAVEEMDEISTKAMINGEEVPLTPALREKMQAVNRSMNEQGMRVIAVAIRKDVHQDATYTVKDEADMTLVGFVGFLDPPKASAVTAIRSLHEHGVDVKVLTGDNAIVARKVCQDVGIDAARFYLGSQLEEMSDEEIIREINDVQLYAKLTPLQKARIIRLLQAAGHTVGFMGDGINDAPALRKADVGISVDNAADITKDASSIILLEKSLNVLEDGVIGGRQVFNNMMKYIKITISSNFGNVFSILVASAFLPFLPMLSLQLLLQNLIYDLSQMTIPWDHVDEIETLKPVKWGIRGLLRFTLVMGPISSIFDLLTFAVMWFVFHADTMAQQGMFQAGWFTVGLTTQLFAFQVIRTRFLPVIQSRASRLVTFGTFLALFFGLLLVTTPLRQFVDFLRLPNAYWGWYAGIVVLYLCLTQAVKRIYIRRYHEWM